MRLPSLVPGAIFAPGNCMICGGNEGQMVDTGVDIPGDGRMYICVRWCAPRIAGLLDERAPEERCTATKANGRPCTAKALPGYAVCVAHLRVQQREEEHGELAVHA
jgi:hypothetical protein